MGRPPFRVDCHDDPRGGVSGGLGQSRA
jgi:hypothetical protein